MIDGIMKSSRIMNEMNNLLLLRGRWKVKAALFGSKDWVDKVNDLTAAVLPTGRTKSLGWAGLVGRALMPNVV